MPDQRAAVVIPVKNEKDGLRELLASVLGQIGPDDEVVVVDGGSTDGTWDTLAELTKADPRLKPLRDPGALPGRGRNVGISSTSAPIIVQIDGGCLVEDNWFAPLVEPIRADLADFVTGQVYAMPLVRQVLGETADVGKLIFASTSARARGEGTMAGGASVAFRRELWERSGGHPEWLRCGSDVLYARKVASLNPRQRFAADSVAYWQMGPHIRHVYGRGERYARANVLLDPDLSSTSKPALTKLGAMVSTLALGAAWPPILALLPAGMTALILRRAVKTMRRYASNGESLKGRRAASIFGYILGIEAAVALSEVVGSAKGIGDRVTKPQTMALLRTYHVG